MSRTKTMIIIGSIWVLSLGISIGPLFGWKEKKHEVTHNTCTVTTNLGYVLFSVISSFYIPAMIIVIIYSKIYQAATKQSEFLKTGIKKVKGGSMSTKSPVLLRVHSGRRPNTTSPSLSEAERVGDSSSHLLTPGHSEQRYLLARGSIPMPS